MGSRSVADAIAGAAASAGTRFAFGVPGGGANLDLVDACGRHGIDFVLCHGETAGVLMASAYAELTGLPGLALATRGPGALSAANGTAHALLDRLPVLVVTDAIARDDRQRITHQFVDHAAIFGACAKVSLEIGTATPERVAHGAVRTALGTRPGPVHLDVVLDAPAPEIVGGPQVAPATPNLDEWADRFATARRPVLLLGGGARYDVEGVRAFLAATRIPTLVTYKAKGIVADSHPCFRGVLTGAALERCVLEEADLLLAVGLEGVELIPNRWPYRAPMLVLSRWHPDVGYFGDADTLVGNVMAALERLKGAGEKYWDAPTNGTAALEELPAGDTPRGLTPTAVVTAVRDEAPPRTIATVDAGAHMLVAMHMWPAAQPGDVLISSGLATMGYALPAAIGAALTRPQQRVVAFSGDGGLGMCLAELEVLTRRALDVCVVVFNDSCLSLIDVKQKSGPGGPAVTYADTDFVAAARAFGVAGDRVCTDSELKQALATWTVTRGPRLIDVRVDPSQYRDVLRVIRG